MAGRDRIRIQPAGAYAANLLHLSEQVPAKAVFLTDGPSRRLKVGVNEIVLKRTTPRAMAAAGRISGLLFQALKYLGKANVTMERMALLGQAEGDLDDAPSRSMRKKRFKELQERCKRVVSGQLQGDLEARVRQRIGQRSDGNDWFRYEVDTRTDSPGAVVRV
jgi:hypothetical protein